AQTAFKTKYVCQNTFNACHMRLISMPRDRVPVRIKTHGYRILSKTVKPKSFIEECALNTEHRQMYFGRHQCNVTPESCKAFLQCLNTDETTATVTDILGYRRDEVQLLNAFVSTPLETRASL
ncbi:MAG: hypothetical protein WAM39_31680, partial [Bryobacteraceae bacterium]